MPRLKVNASGSDLYSTKEGNVESKDSNNLGNCSLYIGDWRLLLLVHSVVASRTTINIRYDKMIVLHK